jgi:glycosyltransferase involved in cell wall biosynthesis
MGGDVRVAAASAHGRSVVRALKNLDLVFYQSSELKEKAAELLGTSAADLPSERHVVLPHGIPEPPVMSRRDLRHRTRAALGVRSEDVVLLYLGRITRQKGMLELVEALRLSMSVNSAITCILVGSKAGFDETSIVETKLREIPSLRGRVNLLPECKPENIWQFLSAADVFVFPSHNEGMPNSLLEAMVMEVPAIAFAIPALQELDGGSGAVELVPPFDCKLFAEAILRLSASRGERTQLGEKGKAIVMDRYVVDKSMAAALKTLKPLITERRSLEIQCAE